MRDPHVTQSASGTLLKRPAIKKNAFSGEQMYFRIGRNFKVTYQIKDIVLSVLLDVASVWPL